MAFYHASTDLPTAVTNYDIYELYDKNLKRSKECLSFLISNHWKWNQKLPKQALPVTDNVCFVETTDRAYALRDKLRYIFEYAVLNGGLNLFRFMAVINAF